METQIFHHAKIQSSKNPLKRNQNPSRYDNSVANLKFQHQPKISSCKNPHMKILDLLLLLLLPREPKSLKLLYSIMNLNTISLPWQAKPTKQRASLSASQPSFCHKDTTSLQTQEQHLGVCFPVSCLFPIIYLHLSIYCPNAASQMAAAAAATTTLITLH